MSDSALVIGTAGHIDHGKTSLIRALTGVDLDALPEEIARGITIELGFTALTLPSGARCAFVDVPGHERLVRTMIAGAAGVGAAMLCVAADDGVMPQTREHLAILDLLGVKRGLVVVTKADLVDAELLELAVAEVADRLVGTSLAGAPVLPFSSVTGLGRDAVIAALEALTAEGSGASAAAVDAPFRLPVDRAFSRAGFGTVVTGTAWSGTVAEGDTLRLLPGALTARVRGLQVHGVSVPRAEAGSRVALNLAGLDPEQVGRGVLLAKGDVPEPLMLDVRYQHLADAPPLADGASVRVLLGTAERLGRLFFADPIEELQPGRSVWAQLRLDGPLPCLPRDRFILRRPSPAQTLGGGVVVDPWTRRMRGKDRKAWVSELSRLHAGERLVWLERAGEAGLDPKAWAARGGQGGQVLGDRVFAPRVVGRLTGLLLDALAAFHGANPLQLGAHRRELKRERLGHLSDKVFDGLVERLISSKMAASDGPLLRMAGFQVQLSEAQRDLQDRVVERISAAGLVGMEPKALYATFDDAEVASLLRLAEEAGRVRTVAGVGFVSPAPLTALVSSVRGWFASHDTLSAPEFKELSGGLSRKTAIPLLEWLDTQKVTQRFGDVRRAGR